MVRRARPGVITPSASLPAFARALQCAKRSYLGYPGVLGVAGGFKFRAGRRAGAPAVQFFVEQKVKRPRRRLPRFVYGRGPRQAVLRSLRFPTDVIQVKPPRFACGAGKEVRALGRRGSVTMIFRDKTVPRSARTSTAFYLLTCAHVVGDLQHSPPVRRNLHLDRGAGPDPFAVVLKNTVARRGRLEFDLALARVFDSARPAGDLLVEGGGTIRGWLEPEQLSLGDTLVLNAASGRRRGSLDSLEGEFRVRLGRTSYRVGNLWGLRLPVEDGDSGGLVHRRGRAAGILVARSPGGFAWWQPLGPALRNLNRRRPRTHHEPFKGF